MFDGTKSSSESISHGVAQGSVLGPLLFSIYINDLPNVFKILNDRMYADDTVLFCEIKKGDGEKRIKEVNNELSIFSEWCKKFFLTINVQKTRCMMFSSSKQRINNEFHGTLPELFLNNVKLAYVEQYRYLGIELDSHLKMDSHMEKIIRRCKPMLYSLAKLRSYINESTAIEIYKTYMMAILENGLYLVDNPVLVEKLQKIQNRALRISYRKQNTHPSFLLHLKAHLLSLDLRRKCSLMNYINLKLVKGDSTFELKLSNDNRIQGSEEKMVTVFPKYER